MKIPQIIWRVKALEGQHTYTISELYFIAWMFFKEFVNKSETQPDIDLLQLCILFIGSVSLKRSRYARKCIDVTYFSRARTHFLALLLPVDKISVCSVALLRARRHSNLLNAKYDISTLCAVFFQMKLACIHTGQTPSCSTTKHYRRSNTRFR